MVKCSSPLEGVGEESDEQVETEDSGYPKPEGEQQVRHTLIGHQHVLQNKICMVDPQDTVLHYYQALLTGNDCC